MKPCGGMGRAKGGTLISGVGSRVLDLRFGVEALVCRVQGLGFGVQVLGFGVWVLGFTDATHTRGSLSSTPSL